MFVTSVQGGDFVLTSWKGRHPIIRVAKDTLQMFWSVRAPGTWEAPGPALIVEDTVDFHSYAAVILAVDVGTGLVPLSRKKRTGRRAAIVGVADDKAQAPFFVDEDVLISALQSDTVTATRL